MATWDHIAQHLKREEERLTKALQGVAEARRLLVAFRTAEATGDASAADVRRWKNAYMRLGEPGPQAVPREVGEDTRAEMRARWTPERKQEASRRALERRDAKKKSGA